MGLDYRGQLTASNLNNSAFRRTAMEGVITPVIIVLHNSENVNEMCVSNKMHGPEWDTDEGLITGFAFCEGNDKGGIGKMPSICNLTAPALPTQPARLSIFQTPIHLTTWYSLSLFA